MSWEETHRRTAAIREIEQIANHRMDGELPWLPGFDELFGDPARLLVHLRYRWNLALQTQLDGDLPAYEIERQRAALVRRNAGVLRILERHTLVPTDGHEDKETRHVA